MREAAEAIDDHLVRHGVLVEVLVAELSEQPDRLLLVSGILAVLERQIDENALAIAHRLIEPVSDCRAREAECYWIGREGPGATAV